MIAYRHTKLGTLALDLPTKQFLQDQLFPEHATVTLFMIGSAQLHPNEIMDRLKGRELVRDRMQLTMVEFTHVEIRGTKHIYHFRGNVPNYKAPKTIARPIVFGLSTIKESNNVKLMYAEFVGDSQ